MTIEERILRNDRRNHYTDAEIQTHVKDGVYWYTNYEDFLADWIAGFCAPEEAPDAWDKLDRATVDGVEYRYDVAL